MLQVARVAPPQLGESRDLVASFFESCLNPDGGFRNRAGESDLYYTVFGLDGLCALQAPLPGAAVLSYVDRFGYGATLDFVHLTCLIRICAALRAVNSGHPPRALLHHLERYRAADGGYSHSVGATSGSAYAAYLALGAHQDLGAQIPDPDRFIQALGRLKADDGGYSNQPGERCGLTPATAGVVAALRQLDAPIEPHLGMWLLDRCHSSGGFLATPDAPMPDLLSTATALHALAGLQVPLGGLADRCLDFVDSLWTNRGGFFGSWADDDVDCEYTYYGLLAIGHATLANQA
jgi:prenyltransferase beta subunit